MRKPYFLFAMAIFVCAFFLLLISPSSKTIFRTILNSSDLLFPFAVYQSILDPASHPDWIFGGYTPFPELILGFLLWLPTRSIPITIFLYAVIQPVLIALSLFELGKRVAGIHWKLFGLHLLSLSTGILLYIQGTLPFYFFLFSWYMHISTFCLTLIALGLLIQCLLDAGNKRAGWLKSLILLCAVCSVATLSDALFLSQFVAPAVLLVIVLLTTRLVAFRRGAWATLAVLYASAAGLAMFRIPVLWGADRFSLGGVYLSTKIDRIIANIPIVAGKLASVWAGNFWLAAAWFGFYLFCVTLSAHMFFRPSLRSAGTVQKRLLAVLIFFVLQVPTTLAAGLTSVEPAVRYLLPVLFMPLLSGWPFLVLGQPGFLTKWYGKPFFASGLLLFVAIFAWAVTTTGSLSMDKNAWAAYPDYVRCLDENTSRYHLGYGMAQYWLARPITLLSKKGLRMVAVDVFLKPNPILNNTDGYDQDFDFIVVDGVSPEDGFMNNGMIRKETVLATFGEPAATFQCTSNEILVYSRESDDKFRTWFRRSANDLQD